MKRFLILIFIIIFTDRSVPESIIMVTNWGTNACLMTYIDTLVANYNRSDSTKIQICHASDPLQFAREVEFKFLMPNATFAPDIFVPTENILTNRLPVSEPLSGYFDFNAYFQPVIVKHLQQNRLNLFPLEISTFVIFYNKRLFKELGINVPSPDNFTLSEFSWICKNLKSRKISNFSPMVIGMKGDDFKKGATFLLYIMLRCLGPVNMQLFLSGKLPWNNKELITSFKVYQTIQSTHRIFNSDFQSISDLEAQQRFSEKRAGMYISSTGYLSSPFQPSELGILPFFNLNQSTAGGDHYTFIELNNSLCINRDSPHKANAIQFLKSLLQPDNINRWNHEVKRLSSIRSTDLQSLTPNTRLIYDILNRNPVLPFNWGFESISTEYNYLALVTLQKIITTEYKADSLEHNLETIHKKVKQNGWYHKIRSHTVE